MTKLLESSWDARQGLAPGRRLWDVGGYGPAAFSSSFGRDPPWAVGREVAGEIGDDFQLVSVPGPRNTGAQGWGGTGVGGALGVLAWAAASLARRARATSDGDPPLPPPAPFLGGCARANAEPVFSWENLTWRLFHKNTPRASLSVGSCLGGAGCTARSPEALSRD